MMQYERILNSLKRGVVAPVYLLYGEEEYLQEKIINAFKETILTPEMAAFNCDVVEGEKYTPAQLVDLSNTLPAFAE
ncbi:MAG TPA: DNA polymerase III subunit delta, partial [Peptococcaceae bacterium]|nr:DNA polymerase III subunit delta [Peptococcaceae bacterium]